MTKFGKMLRSLRQASNDYERLNRRLTQERLGEFIGREMDDRGFSGAAISDWERGESRINAQDRNVLIALIRVLYKCGGLHTSVEADQLLGAGNYRALDVDETRKIFKQEPGISDVEQYINVNKEEHSESPIQFFIESLFAISNDGFRLMIQDAQKGPPPFWPRLSAAFMRKLTDHFSISIKTIGWVWVWLIGWWLIGPSLHWPFADQNEALISLGKYMAGTIVIPLMIGLLVNTKDNPYWEQHKDADPILLRLYTYQGAGIGFNLGYLFTFLFSLVFYYLNLEATIWINIAATTLGLVLGSIAAHAVPYNLWLAYGRLTLKDGGIFFIAALLGPMWGFFFLEYYSILLTPVLGIVVILLAITMTVMISMWQARKRAQ